MGIMPGGAHYAQTLGVPPLPLLLLGLMVALCRDIRCSCSASHGEPADVLEPPLPLHRHYVPHCVECLRSGHHTSHQPHYDGVDEKYDIIVINGTRPKPAYDRQGIAGGYSSSDTFWGVF